MPTTLVADSRTAIESSEQNDRNDELVTVMTARLPTGR